MRTEPKNVSRKEEAFKATRKHKNKKSEFKNISNMSDEEEDNVVRNLKRGQGKLPFKCFKFGRVGHFASKCTYVEHK